MQQNVIKTASCATTLELADRLAALQPSAIIRMSQQVREMKAAGQEIYSLSIGVPGFLPPEHVHVAASRAVAEDTGEYLPGRGSVALIETFRANMAAKGFVYSTQEVCAQPGGKGALFNLMMALVNAGDTVVVPAPYWASYPEMVRLAGGVVRAPAADARHGYKLSPAQLTEALQGAKGLIFNNPSNPTGMLYTPDEVRALAEVVRNWNGWIISDDIYDRLIFTREERAAHLLDFAPELRERLVIVQSVSKTYGMPGWRIGFAAGPQKIISALVDLASQSFTNLPAPSMAAAAAALSGSHAFLPSQVARLCAQRDLTLEAVRAMGLPCPVPDGAFYVFPQVGHLFGKATPAGETVTNDEDFCRLLLAEAGVAVVPGGAFGDAGAVRLSYAGKEAELREALYRMADWVDGLT